MADREFNPERCDWHEQQMRDLRKGVEKQVSEVRSDIRQLQRSVYTQNGEPGLIETVRRMALVQKWQTLGIFLVLAMQIGEPLKKLVVEILRNLLR